MELAKLSQVAEQTPMYLRRDRLSRQTTATRRLPGVDPLVDAIALLSSLFLHGGNVFAGKIRRVNAQVRSQIAGRDDRVASGKFARGRWMYLR